MPENTVKVSQSATASPAARTGAGDLTERALGRERRALHATPHARIQPVHPKKLFSAPVSKFTCRRAPVACSPNLARIRSCLDEYRRAAAPPVTCARVKAASMEDLTPSKRVKKGTGGETEAEEAAAHPADAAPVTEEQAAARISRFLVVAAWRRRREEVHTLHRALDTKRLCNERLRVQVWVLKSLLDADNAKVVLAMRELERLKQLLRDKDLEKAILEREKLALEKDVSAAEDRASELSIGWRNSRNELDAVRCTLERCERERAGERAAAGEARAQRDRAYTRINLLEEELAQHETLLNVAEKEAAALRRESEGRQRALQHAVERLRLEQEVRSRHCAEYAALQARAAQHAQEADALRSAAAELRARAAQLEGELASAREQLAWWPRPLTRMLGAARGWLRHPMSLPEAVMWSLIPSRHGCY